MSGKASALLIVVALVTSAPVAYAQGNVWVAGSAEPVVHEFTDDDVPNRLDGSAVGWNAIGGARIGRHWAVRIEWSQGGEIADERAFALELPGRTVTIESTLKHRTRTFAALTGFTHSVSSRVRLAYVAGVAFSNVRRTFVTNAPGLVLVTPSVGNATGRSVTDDSVVSPIAGADAVVRLIARLEFVTGIRVQRLTLEEDLVGRSIRPFAGLGWSF